MVARSESWSRRADRGLAAAAAAVAVVAFLLAWSALHHGFYARSQIVDTPVYQAYGEAVMDGRVPYRDFDVEYPPGALPVFVLPAVGLDGGDWRAYDRRFRALMALLGTATLVFLALALASLGADVGRLGAALGFFALAPLALGSVVLSRFDLWPAALTAAAVAALVAGRVRLGCGILGLGVAAKLYPALLLPPALVYAWRRLGARAALGGAAVFVAVVGAVFLPFAILSPDGVWESFSRQAGRPLQLESLGSALLLAAHHLGGVGLAVETSSGSQNLVGRAPDAIATASSVVQGLAVVAAWIVFARGPATRERLLAACAAAVASFVAFGKVLSPQFLIWLLPLVPLVRGRRGIAASALLAAALLLTQLWFPYRYWDLALRFDQLTSWLVVSRDVALAALAAFLIWSLSRPEPGPARS